MGLLGPKLSEIQKRYLLHDAPYLLPANEFGFVTILRALAFAVFCFFLLELLIWILVIRFPPSSKPFVQALLEWAIQLFAFFSACLILRAGLIWPRALAFGGKFAIVMWVVRWMVFSAFAAVIIGLVLTVTGVAPPWRTDLEAIRLLVPKTRR